MHTLNSLLDKASEMCGSDMQAAARLRVTRSAVSKWRHGGKIAPEQLARLVELTQQDPAIAVQVLQEQDATPAERKLWGALWDRLSPVTSTVAGALLIAVLWAPSPAAVARADTPQTRHYAKWLARHVRAALARLARRRGAAYASPVLA